MNRKEFIRTCGLSCVSLVGISGLLQSCINTRYIEVTGQGQKLSIAKSEFLRDKDKPGKYLRYLIANPASINFPIVVYRFSETEYKALLLECSHQHNELNVNGDLLTCSAHGSEFNNRGEVTQGPAEQNLKEYKITLEK